jgi:hypothetical protein
VPYGSPGGMERAPARPARTAAITRAIGAVDARRQDAPRPLAGRGGDPVSIPDFRAYWDAIRDKAELDQLTETGAAPLAGMLRAAERNLADAEPVCAKDVTVRKLFRPECHRPGCGWTGAEHATFADASAERLDHLNWHILGS